MKKLLLILGLLTIPAFAAPAALPFETWALQDNGSVIDPLGIQGFDPLLIIDQTSVNHLFQTDFSIQGSDHWSASIDVPNFQGSLSYIIDCDHPLCGVGYGWSMPVAYRPVAGTLTVTLNGVTENYDFRYQDPAPEPSTLILLGTALVGWVKFGRAAK